MQLSFFKRYAMMFMVLFLCLLNTSCKKDKQTDTFCDKQRTIYQSVTNKEGMVVYSSKFNRYGISFAVTAPDNIDSQVIGYVCSLQKEMQQVGLQVIVSGTLKAYNQSENMQPEIAGQELFYLETTNLIKKP
jgi:hypothetical protein